MAQLRQETDRLVKLNIEVLVIGPDKPEAFKKFWKKESLPFAGLPNPDHSIAKLYGQEIKIFKLGRMPAQMLIDKSGIIKFVHYGKSMSDIPELSEIEKVLTS